MALPEMTCREMVELITDYLEGALSPADRARAEEHLATCGPCNAYLEQMRLTIEAVGALTEESISPAAQADLLRAFRGWKEGR